MDHSVEQWKPVKGFPNYEVSDQGRVRSIGGRISARVMKLHTRPRDGYQTVGLVNAEVRKCLKVHRLVAEAFIVNPETLPLVDHVNGNRSDNHVANLRWVDHSLNQINRHKSSGILKTVGVAKSASKTNPYRSHIRVAGVKMHLGVFPTVQAAADARVVAAKGYGI